MNISKIFSEILSVCNGSRKRPGFGKLFVFTSCFSHSSLKISTSGRYYKVEISNQKAREVMLWDNKSFPTYPTAMDIQNITKIQLHSQIRIVNTFSTMYKNLYERNAQNGSFLYCLP